MKKDLNILIVEDNESDADLIVRCLTKAGFKISFERVETSDELKEALLKPSWDIVFSDFQLPGLDATGALKIFKTFNLDIPFIVISGTIGEEAAVNLIKLGAQNYVMKGNLQKLPGIVDEELAEAHDRREQKELESRAKGQDEKISFFKMNLLYLLESNSIKQSHLSREIGISKQAISDWIKKDSLLSIHQALKLTNYFKISVEDLLTSNLKNSKNQERPFGFEFLKKVQTPLHIIDFDGSVACSNHAFCELLGFSEYEFNSRLFSELIHPEDVHHMMLQLKRASDERRIFSQMDLRYISAKGGFRWLNSLCISSIIDKKIFIFSFPEPDQAIETFSSEQFQLEKLAMKELAKIQAATNLGRKLEFIKEIDTKLVVNIDRNIFKCLIRSLFNHFQFIEFATTTSYEILLKSRIEKDRVVLSATINCTINPKRLDLSRVQKVAGLVGAEVSENYAGTIYSFYIVFPR